MQDADNGGEDNVAREIPSNSLAGANDREGRFELERFLVAQKAVYPTALAELRAGDKRSHWMWFIFPQVAGLGFSSMAQRYAIVSHAEAVAYLHHEVLGPRLVECTEAMLSHAHKTAHDILGSPDDLKFRSSMTLFASVSKKGSLFERALAQFYGGRCDERTLALLRT